MTLFPSQVGFQGDRVASPTFWIQNNPRLVSNQILKSPLCTATNSHLVGEEIPLEFCVCAKTKATDGIWNDNPPCHTNNHYAMHTTLNVTKTILTSL